MHICYYYKYILVLPPLQLLTHNILVLKSSPYLSLNMSIAYHLLFFLCIFLHACKARLLITVDKLEKYPHFSIKGDEINDLDSFPKHIGVMNEGNNRMKTWLVPQKPRKRRRTNQKVLKTMIKNSDAIQTKSLANSSVSWRVPHKKPRKKDPPGFNLDYSPPKTHPPSHN